MENALFGAWHPRLHVVHRLEPGNERLTSKVSVRHPYGTALNPSSKRRLATVAMKGAKRLDERILNQVVEMCAVTQHAKQRGVDTMPLTGEERTLRIAVACDAAPRELQISAAVIDRTDAGACAAWPRALSVPRTSQGVRKFARTDQAAKERTSASLDDTCPPALALNGKYPVSL